ncbi:uncharacterized protein A4U43_C02F21440 [Asparagus officinalis]|uniref:Uncharacterized protein n=1 Tax=Asparagus officinalis TaxID=4686 RepID=A0A5P1FKN6_ASPOF|nr:uncharacterized protein A4U43_C02F21440 [Asparagus officinalis]
MYEGLGCFLPDQYDPSQPGLSGGQEATAELARIEERLEHAKASIVERMQDPASTHDFPPLLKRERGVDVGATFERVAKRARGKEAVVYADMREGQVVAGPPPNLGATLPIAESVPPTLTCWFLLTNRPFQKTTVAIGLVLSDGGEEEDELLDYSGGDDLTFRRSSNLDLPTEDLEITSSLPTQTSALASPRLHATEQVDHLVMVATPMGAEEEKSACEKAPSQKEEVPIQQGVPIPKEKVSIQEEVLNQGEEASTQKEAPVEEETLIHEASS